MNVCKNNHIIEKSNQIIILKGCVMHCHNCGNTNTAENVNALYLCDEITSAGEEYHIFYLYPNLFCRHCGKQQHTFAVRCYSIEESSINYESYKIPSNVVKNKHQWD